MNASLRKIDNRAPSGTIAIGIFVAHVEARRREGKSLLTALCDWRIYIAGAVCLAAFAVINPHIFLDWKQQKKITSRYKMPIKSLTGAIRPPDCQQPALKSLKTLTGAR